MKKHGMTVKVSERNTGVDPYKKLANILNRIEMQEFIERKEEQAS